MNVTSGIIDPRHSSSLMAVALLAMATAIFFWHPLALLLVACVIAVISPTNDFKWLFLVSACALFMILNVSRLVDGDLILYVRVQDYISQKPFWTLLDKGELRLISDTYRATEIGFYAPLWLLSLIIPDSKTAIALAATLGIYVPTFLGLMVIGEYERWSKGAILMAALFAFFAGINIVQTSHLIRQYISSAVLFYGFALFIARRYRWAAVVAFASCTIHNGSAPLILTTATICWLFQYREGKRMGLISLFIRSVGAVAMLVAMMAVVPIIQGNFLEDKATNIRWGHFVVVGSFFLIAHIAIQWQHLRLRSLYYARLMFLAIYLTSLGFFLIGIPLFALRYFAYLEWLYGLMVGGIMFAVFRNSPQMRVFARFTVSVAAAAILVARIANSEWMYGPGNNSLLNWDFFQVAELVAR
jgi:EpsG family